MIYFYSTVILPTAKKKKGKKLINLLLHLNLTIIVYVNAPFVLCTGFSQRTKETFLL